VSEDRLRVWTARFLAPAAFFFAAVVLILLVQNGLGSEGSGNESTTPTTVPTQPTGTGGATTTGSRPTRRRFYRVQGGDTLDSIAVQFETTVEELLRLNPGIDPLALSPGQRIRVR
jgi:LysM repeat protein